MRTRRKVAMRLLPAAVCFLLVVDRATAGKDRTSVPTPPPTGVPSITPRPTSTRYPTDAPSSRPSLAPSLDPTLFPTSPSPTPAPTISAKPTTLSPTTTPTASIVSLGLPLLEFTFDFPPGTALDDDMFANTLNSFVNDFLASNAYRQSFDRLDMITAVQYDAVSGVAVTRSEAVGVFSDPSLREDDLAKVITTYFAFWGGEDLEKSLKAEGLPAKSILIKIDGQELERHDTSATPKMGNSGSDNQTRNAIIISVVLVVLFLVAIFMVWYCWIRKKKSPASEKHVPLDGSDFEDTNDISSPKRDSSDEPLSPRKYMLGVDQSPPRDASLPSIASDEMRSFSGVVSLEESLFTTDESFGRQQPPASFQYDARRLDNVINTAKGIKTDQGPV